jgi:hypothetical protein
MTRRESRGSGCFKRKARAENVVNRRTKIEVPTNQDNCSQHFIKEDKKDMNKLRSVTTLFLLLLGLTFVNQVAAAVLSDGEVNWLVYMREEEKLARDVYAFLYEKWHSRIFNNISINEQKHMDAIKTLLDRYAISDPAEGKGPGEFANTEIQTLYNDLIAQGSLSLEEALRVGLFIEGTDISDLEAAYEETDHKDIGNVYLSLLAGSANHLKAFVSHLSKYYSERLK